jgi:hypothetical protein
VFSWGVPVLCDCQWACAVGLLWTMCVGVVGVCGVTVFMSVKFNVYINIFFTFFSKAFFNEFYSSSSAVGCSVFPALGVTTSPHGNRMATVIVGCGGWVKAAHMYMTISRQHARPTGETLVDQVWRQRGSRENKVGR